MPHSIKTISRRMFKLCEKFHNTWLSIRGRNPKPFKKFTINNVSEALNNGKEYSYCWFIADGYMGEGPFVKVVCTTEGIKILYEWRSQIFQAPPKTTDVIGTHDYRLLMNSTCKFDRFFGYGSSVSSSSYSSSSSE